MSDEPRLNLGDVHPHGTPARSAFPRRALRWVSRHPVLVLVLIAAPILLGIGLNWMYSPRLPTLEAGQVESVTVTLRAFGKNERMARGQLVTPPGGRPSDGVRS